MTVWMVRSGGHGEWESWALTNGLAGGGWTESPDLSGCESREQVLGLLKASWQGHKEKALINWAGQLWSLRARIKVGDIVILPLKTTKRIAIGRCTSGYTYVIDPDPGRRHAIGVKWERIDVPRADIKQDLLFALGAFLTVCQVQRNDAERRLTHVLNGGRDPGAELKPLVSAVVDLEEVEAGAETAGVDIETVSLDGIRTRLIETFQSHNLSILTAAILRARGLQCVVSPPGPDKGIDIVAGGGPLGLDSPRIVVQCKSQQDPVDTEVVQRLQGAMGTIGADQALLVAIGGINKAAASLLVNQQFRVKVWSVDDLLSELLDTYTELDEEIREMLSLKKVWTLSMPEA